MADKARVDRPGEGLVKLEAGTQGVEGAGVSFTADCAEHPNQKPKIKDIFWDKKPQ